ncbi:MAG TPA: UV DNA damage repair endonuclease UvsE [Anaerolineae bacterium]|nr:UV DNA damage repair endonuclease UvsE [Anaerolineae bacterium]
MRLGFAVKVLGQPDLKSHDTRRWQNEPHLSVSLAYVRDIFGYLDRTGIRMYRLSSDLAPYLTHPGLPQFHHQIDECAAELALVGKMALEADLRLSFHPSQYVVLNAVEEAIATRSAAQITALAQMLEAMGLGAEAVVVVHLGGVYGDKKSALQRFVIRYEGLPEIARQRLALENDDASYSVGDLHHIHQQTGLRLVFDYLHFLNHNPEGLSLAEALALTLDTWPADVTPKVHFSSPSTAMRTIEHTDSRTGGRRMVLRPPRLTQHADFIDPFAFTAFLRQAQGLRDFDVMLEAKAKDLALLRLRDELRRFAPELLLEEGG